MRRVSLYREPREGVANSHLEPMVSFRFCEVGEDDITWLVEQLRDDARVNKQTSPKGVSGKLHHNLAAHLRATGLQRTTAAPH